MECGGSASDLWELPVDDLDAAVEAIRSGSNGYTVTQGIGPLRERLVAELHDDGQAARASGDELDDLGGDGPSPLGAVEWMHVQPSFLGLIGIGVRRGCEATDHE